METVVAVSALPVSPGLARCLPVPASLRVLRCTWLESLNGPMNSSHMLGEESMPQEGYGTIRGCTAGKRESSVLTPRPSTQGLSSSPSLWPLDHHLVPG